MSAILWSLAIVALGAVVCWRWVAASVASVARAQAALAESNTTADELRTRLQSAKRGVGDADRERHGRVALETALAEARGDVERLGSALAQLAQGAKISALQRPKDPVLASALEMIGARQTQVDAVEAARLRMQGRVSRLGDAVSTGVAAFEEAAGDQSTTAVAIAVAASRISATSSALSSAVDAMGETLDDAAKQAASGRRGLDQIRAMLADTATTSTAIAEQLATIDEKARRITRIVETITRVAAQTNLLSLNAEIEAVKAGEHGRGFTVVATEMRRLADQTSVATLDIEAIVADVDGAVAAGVKGTSDFADAMSQRLGELKSAAGGLDAALRGIHSLGPRFADIGAGVSDQHGAAQSIGSAVLKLSETSEAAAIASMRLHGIVGDLQTVAAATPVPGDTERTSL